MNLTAEQYLNLVDQMTMLRIQNEKYKQDNTLLTKQIHKQQDLSHDKQNHNPIVPTNSYKLRKSPEDSQMRVYRSADDYVEDFKKSMNSMQKNICQQIAASSTQNMKYIVQQIKMIKEQIKAIAEQKCQSVQFETKETKSSPLPRQIKHSSRNPMKQVSKQNQAQQQDIKEAELLQKMKNLYMICTKSKQVPSKKQITQWVNNVNLSSELVKPQTDYNPIQASKIAKGKLKCTTDNTDRKVVEQFIENYKKQNLKRQAEGEQKIKLRRTKSITSQNNGDQSAFTVLPPKNLKNTKSPQSMKKVESKLKKKSILKKDILTKVNESKAKEDMNLNSKSQQKPKIKKQQSKKDLKPESKKNLRESKKSLKQKIPRSNNETSVNKSLTRKQQSKNILESIKKIEEMERKQEKGRKSLKKETLKDISDKKSIQKEGQSVLKKLIRNQSKKTIQNRQKSESRDVLKNSKIRKQGSKKELKKQQSVVDLGKQKDKAKARTVEKSAKDLKQKNIDESRKKQENKAAVKGTSSSKLPKRNASSTNLSKQK